MAKENNTVASAPVKKKRTYNRKKKQLDVENIAKKYSVVEAEDMKFKAKKALETLQYQDVNRSPSRTFQIYSKERLRTYMRNPVAQEANIRNLSRFLYRVSYPYRRIIHYFAEMFDPTAYTAVPKGVSMIKKPSDKKVIKDYEQVITELEKMNMPMQIFKMLVIAWREDIAYGYTYENDAAFFIMPLDPDYCRISSYNYDGTINFAFDLGYFDSHQEYLEWWDPEFKQRYNKWKNGTAEEWQELDINRTFCIKINMDDIGLILPPFVALFEPIIDLIDLQSIEAVKEALSAYKMVVLKAETLERAERPNQFKVDLDLAVEYFKKFRNNLPDEVASGISLLDFDTIDFKGTSTDDVNMISNSMANLFQNAGVSQILDRRNISGQVAFTAAMISDTMYALRPILPQIEAWVNRYISYALNGNVMTRIKYLMVSPYTKATYKDSVVNAAQYGVPVKLQIAAMHSTDPLESYQTQYLENEILKCHSEWIPLLSSFTQSSTARTDEQIKNITKDDEQSADDEKDPNAEEETTDNTEEGV